MALKSLKDTYGDLVELLGAGEEEEAYRIIAELAVDGRNYVVLQSADAADADEFELFRVGVGEDGQPQLEMIEDEDEWEIVAEAYDDILFGSADRP